MPDSTQTFPFRSVLNLRLLIEYWEKNIQQGNFPGFAQSVLDYIKQAPELRQPIEDLSVLQKHQPFINFLMTAVIPQASMDTDLAAVIFPFQLKSVFSTNALHKVIDLETVESRARINFPGNHMVLGKIVKACLLIIEKFYHVSTSSQYDRPLLLTIRNEETGLDRVYKVDINHQFCEVVCKATPKPIDKQVLKFLLEKVYDTDLWLQYLHPEDYEFQGFIVMRLSDVTEQEMLSAIKYDLLEKNAVSSKESFAAIQHKLRSLFGIPEMRLGIAYLDPNNNIILNNAAVDCWKSLAGSCDQLMPCEDYSGSIYERSWTEKRYITIENLNEYPYKSKAEQALIANGIDNILLAPLVSDDETIGMLELATPVAGKLNTVSAHKVESVLPMFTAAVKRVKEEMATEVRAIIQEECTAIHPTVQWRFFEAGVEVMNKRARGEKAKLEEIAFKDVYPFFGLTDVRNSSTERNDAIQKDLQQNLKLAKDLLLTINEQIKLPILEEVIYKTDKQLKAISRGLASGDETNVLEFLKREINPLVDHFESERNFKDAVKRYRATLDPVFGVVYKRRKSFEESLALINHTIGSYLEEAEVEAQQMFPHYFEKYKTDGIEYTLYVGSSLVKGRKFDPFYLKNFHLWQLITMCEIYRKIEVLKPTLQTSLDITQLILVHDQPISIRFRPDEKHFDVDGAYDIRYEIVKKRIDKAHIKDSGERLTQPGKIAIVYNQAKVENEFKRYFQYLLTKNYVTGSIEELELEELPGATGLKALRFQIAYDEKKTVETSSDELLREIEEGLRVQ